MKSEAVKIALKTPEKIVFQVPTAVQTPKSPGLSVLLGLVLFLMLVVILVFSAGLDASKFIYVDF